ncbi:D-lactate dehydrogenase [Sulfurivirga caldicuralii]|uniref:D-lactate dehydrogenase n=1 Tax=Sulfurivirga caldicuralii TaxID=364032 RepID=A0A1N6DR87_9GAMM|nr:2-hydroxyacid dehydrogenase [Sulfurivirga caldicuralii]SIN73315.1 D-lactate dehydrogenase [Sulfurivirga caldicuralii]
MKVEFYSVRPYEQQRLEALLPEDWVVHFNEAHLGPDTVAQCPAADAVSLFVSDWADAQVLEKLVEKGVRMLMLRSAGFDHVDLAVARRLGMRVGRVPAYSPHAVADHTLALLLTLVRRIHLAQDKVRRADFCLQGLMGFDLNGKRAAVIGLGRIGRLVAQRLQAFGCEVVGHDPYAQVVGVPDVSLEEALEVSDIVSLNCPLTPETRHLLNAERLQKMKPGAVVVNTGRGALIDTAALLDALRSDHLGGAALDVYEFERGLFFEDHRDEGIRDPMLAQLMALPNVVITGHQAFLTQEAVENIARTTVATLQAWAQDPAVAGENFLC